MTTVSFTTRIDPRDHRILNDLARSRKQTVTELSREILAEGIRRLLDPDEIERHIAAERRRLLAAAEQIRRDAYNTETGTG